MTQASDYYGGAFVVPSQIRISGGAKKDFGENGKHSKPKMDLSLTLLKALKKSMLLKTPVNEKNIETVIHEVRERLRKFVSPHSSGGVKESKVDSICDTLISALNAWSGSELINLGLTPEAKCRKILEVLKTLTTGIKGEFLGVHVEIKRILNNIKFLSHVVKTSIDNFIELYVIPSMDALQKSALQRQAKAVIVEMDRQILMLENLLGVTSRSAYSDAFVSDIANNPDFEGLIQDLQIDPDAPVGRNLMFLLNGTNNLADVAAQVYKYMNKIGLSVDELTKANSFAKLQELVAGKLHGKNIDAEHSVDAIQALMALKNNLHVSKDDIASYISKHRAGLQKYVKAKRGGSITAEDLKFIERSFLDDVQLQVTEENGPFAGRTQAFRSSVSRQLSKQKISQKVVLRSFKRTFIERFAHIKASISKIARKIGSEIPITERLDDFMRFLVKFKKLNPEHENLFIAMTSFTEDAVSRSLRLTFLENLNGLLDKTEPLTKGPGGAYFREIKESIHELLKAIDNFNSVFGKMYTSIPIRTETSPRFSSYSGGEGSDSEIVAMDSDFEESENAAKVGGAKRKLYEYEGIEPKKTSRAAEINFGKTLDKTINEARYFYQVAEIEEGVKIMAKEHETYSKNYSNILGEEAAAYIDTVMAFFNKLSSYDYGDAEAKVVGAPGLSDAVKATIRRDRQIFLKFGRDAVIGMIETMQAIDLYLSKFTKSLQQNPRLIKSITPIVEKLELTARFFNDKSVELFRGYEEDVAKAKSFESLISACERMVKSTQSLSNIVHLFDTINHGESIQMAMQPGQILENLQKFKTFISVLYGVQHFNPRLFDSVFAAVVKADMEAIVGGSLLDASDGAFGPDKHPGVAKSFASPVAVITPAAVATTTFLNPTTSEGKAFFDRKEAAKALPKVRADMFNFLHNSYYWAIQTMTSKIISVIATYELFNRPPNYLQLSRYAARNYALGSGIRSILGGADEPVIIDDALELYIRLILLAEWYRDLFEFEKSSVARPAEDIIITFFPQLGNIWGDFVRLIFIDTRDSADGNYSYDQYMQIIRAINDIYRTYKAKGYSCDEVLRAFVVEINRRYGIVKRQEIDDFLNAKDGLAHTEKSDFYTDKPDALQYNLVDTDYLGRDVLPSDRFRKSFPTYVTKDRATTPALADAIQNFRVKVMKNLEFTSGMIGGFDEYGLAEFIKNFTSKIKGQSDPKQKFAMLVNMLNGSRKYDMVDANKLIEFHEFVLFPMTVLEQVKRTLCLGILRYGFRTDTVKYPEKIPVGIMNDDDDLKQVTTLALVADGLEGILSGTPELLVLYAAKSNLNKMIDLIFLETGGTRYPSITFTKLSDTVRVIFAHLENSYKNLRNHLSNEINQEMEDMITGGPGGAPASVKPKLEMLHKVLIRGILNNEFHYGIAKVNTILRDKFTAYGTNLNREFNELIFWKHDMTLIPKFTVHEQVHEFPVFYSPFLRSGNAFSNVADKSAKEEVYQKFVISAPDSLKKDHFEFDKYFMNTTFADAEYDVVGTYKNKGSLSLINRLNNLIYRMVNIFMDKSTKKIYKKLINPLVNGYNSRNIMLGYAINDTNGALHRFEPMDDCVLYSSLAFGLKGLATLSQEKLLGKVPMHLEEDFANLTEIQKELMRAYIPSLEREIGLIVNHAEVLKALVENNIGDYTGAPRVADHSDGTIDGIPMFSTAYRDNATADNVTNEVYKNYYVKLLQSIISTARTVNQGLLDTRRDMEDIPLYFETYSNSIADYVNRNNQYPFMPLSYITLLMHRDFGSAHPIYDTLSPDKDELPGTDKFKLAYGLRGITYHKQEHNMKLAPALETLVKTGVKYGGSLEINALMSGSLDLVKFNMDYIYMQSMSNYKEVQVSSRGVQEPLNLVPSTPVSNFKYPSFIDGGSVSVFSSPINIYDLHLNILFKNITLSSDEDNGNLENFNENQKEIIYSWVGKFICIVIRLSLYYQFDLKIRNFLGNDWAGAGTDLTTVLGEIRTYFSFAAPGLGASLANNFNQSTSRQDMHKILNNVAKDIVAPGAALRVPGDLNNRLNNFVNDCKTAITPITDRIKAFNAEFNELINRNVAYAGAAEQKHYPVILYHLYDSLNQYVPVLQRFLDYHVIGGPCNILSSELYDDHVTKTRKVFDIIENVLLKRQRGNFQKFMQEVAKMTHSNIQTAEEIFFKRFFEWALGTKNFKMKNIQDRFFDETVLSLGNKDSVMLSDATFAAYEGEYLEIKDWDAYEKTPPYAALAAVEPAEHKYNIRDRGLLSRLIKNTNYHTITIDNSFQANLFYGKYKIKIRKENLQYKTLPIFAELTQYQDDPFNRLDHLVHNAGAGGHHQVDPRLDIDDAKYDRYFLPILKIHQNLDALVDPVDNNPIRNLTISDDDTFRKNDHLSDVYKMLINTADDSYNANANLFRGFFKNAGDYKENFEFGEVYNVNDIYEAYQILAVAPPPLPLGADVEKAYKILGENHFATERKPTEGELKKIVAHVYNNFLTQFFKNAIIPNYLIPLLYAELLDSYFGNTPGNKRMIDLIHIPKPPSLAEISVLLDDIKALEEFADDAKASIDGAGAYAGFDGDYKNNVTLLEDHMRESSAFALAKLLFDKKIIEADNKKVRLDITPAFIKHARKYVETKGLAEAAAGGLLAKGNLHKFGFPEGLKFHVTDLSMNAFLATLYVPAGGGNNFVNDIAGAGLDFKASVDPVDVPAYSAAAAADFIVKYQAIAPYNQVTSNDAKNNFDVTYGAIDAADEADFKAMYNGIHAGGGIGFIYGDNAGVVGLITGKNRDVVQDVDDNPKYGDVVKNRILQNFRSFVFDKYRQVLAKIRTIPAESRKAFYAKMIFLQHYFYRLDEGDLNGIATANPIDVAIRDLIKKKLFLTNSAKDIYNVIDQIGFTANPANTITLAKNIQARINDAINEFNKTAQIDIPATQLPSFNDASLGLIFTDDVTSYAHDDAAFESFTKAIQSEIFEKLLDPIIDTFGYIVGGTLEYLRRTQVNATSPPSKRAVIGGYSNANLTVQTGKRSTNDFWKSARNILFMVENDNYQESIEKFLSGITDKKTSLLSNRKSMRALNLFDKKIVPINFHALQREVPFINVMNYVHSYVQFMEELYHYEHSPGKITNWKENTLAEFMAAPMKANKLNKYTMADKHLQGAPKLVLELLFGTALTARAASDERQNYEVINDITLSGDDANAKISEPANNDPRHPIRIQVWETLNMWTIRKMFHRVMDARGDPIEHGAEALDESVLGYTDLEDPSIDREFQL